MIKLKIKFKKHEAINNWSTLYNIPSVMLTLVQFTNVTHKLQAF